MFYSAFKTIYSSFNASGCAHLLIPNVIILFNAQLVSINAAVDFNNYQKNLYLDK
jgi:hypothetical protein